MVFVKYLEFTLAAAFAVLTYSAWLLPAHPPIVSDADRVSTAAPIKPMIVVVVTGKRMTPEERLLPVTSH